jgi:hypothetical protein
MSIFWKMKMWTKNVLCRDMGTSNHISARDENSTRMPAQAFDNFKLGIE